MSKKNLIWGSDPEMFAGYKKDGELFVLPPAWFRVYGGVDYVPDVKHPVFIDAMKELGVLVMEDGVAFEQTIIPSSDWKELFDRINIGKKLLSSQILSKFPNDCLPDVQTVPTINYDVNRWSQEDIEFRMCLVFGCDEDRDAWDFDAPGKVINALKHPFRYGGGHFHVSGSKAIIEEPILAIQNLSMTAGLAAIAFSDSPDLDRARTYLYGRPGKYRPQHYSKSFNRKHNTKAGVEYRTPSNRWTSSFEHASQLFKWAEIGIRNLLEQGLGLELIPHIGQETQDAIVNCDQNKARDILAFVESKI